MKIIYLGISILVMTNSCAPTSTLFHRERLGLYEESISIYESQADVCSAKDFDGYEELLMSLKMGPVTNGVDENEHPDAWQVSQMRMSQLGKVDTSDLSLDEAYKEVVILEGYFSDRPRKCELAGLGCDDVILLGHSPTVGQLQMILTQRSLEGIGRKEKMHIDVIRLCNNYGYTLTARLWLGDAFRVPKNNPAIRLTDSLRHWISKHSAGSS